MNSERTIHPPQPIPYPHNKIIKQLYRFTILLYRLGLGKLIGQYILIISTYGRKTGKVHRTPVEFHRHQGRIFVISGFGDQPDWYRNLQADPHVTLNTDRGIINALARKPQGQHEWNAVLDYLRTSPITNLSQQDLINRLDDPAVLKQIQQWPVITFDPANEEDPPPLTADLVWAWPLILLTAALNILITWLATRDK